MKEVLEKNYETFKKGLISVIGEECASDLIDQLGGDETIMKASFSTTKDSGSAYEGSLVYNIIELSKTALKLNKILPEQLQVDNKSLSKVCLLSQLSKVIMFVPNDNAWEVEKRGMVYKFNTLPGALRMGERSLLLATNAGVKFTDIEFEAMRILDKDSNDDNYSKYYLSTLSMLIKQANEIIMLVNKNI